MNFGKLFEMKSWVSSSFIHCSWFLGNQTQIQPERQDILYWNYIWIFPIEIFHMKAYTIKEDFFIAEGIRASLRTPQLILEDQSHVQAVNEAFLLKLFLNLGLPNCNVLHQTNFLLQLSTNSGKEALFIYNSIIQGIRASSHAPQLILQDQSHVTGH